jgi:hypothetical protein
MKQSNRAKGATSFDSNIGNSLVTFLNRNVTPYPTEVGGPKFDLIPVTERKDLMVNAARMHAEQEYDRIMEMVAVLSKQAEEVKRRLEITDMVHAKPNINSNLHMDRLIGYYTTLMLKLLDWPFKDPRIGLLANLTSMNTLLRSNG